MEMQHDFSTIESLVVQEGWSFDRLRLGQVSWATASKRFESAGGARTAVLYLRPTAEGALSVHGTYESAGEDVLAGHLRLISVKEANKVVPILAGYLQEATRRIENSWGRRVLRLRAAA